MIIDAEIIIKMRKMFLKKKNNSADDQHFIFILLHWIIDGATNKAIIIKIIRIYVSTEKKH